MTEQLRINPDQPGLDLDHRLFFWRWRTEAINEALERQGLALPDFLALRPIERLRVLEPPVMEVREVVENGHLRTLFPSMARLWRVWGRLPSPGEVHGELKSLGEISQETTSQDIAERFGFLDCLLWRFIPLVDEYALIRARTERRFWRNLDVWEFINVAHQSLYEGFYFHFDWPN